MRHTFDVQIIKHVFDVRYFNPFYDAFIIHYPVTDIQIICQLSTTCLTWLSGKTLSIYIILKHTSFRQ